MVSKILLLSYYNILLFLLLWVYIRYYTSASTNQRNCRCRRFSFIKTNIIIFFREGKKITEATYGKEYKIQAEMDKPSRKIFLLVAKLLFNSKYS